MDNKSDEEACVFAFQLAAGSVLPMALYTAIELDLLELIKKAGPEASASASELAAQHPTTNPDAADMIDSILRLLASHSVLICSLKQLADGGVERRYSLAPVCKFLTRNEDGVSVGPLCLLLQDNITWVRVEHVSGDMFVSMTKADAIFMKWVCHGWRDSHCEKLLKNCYEALPENGKVIIAEVIVPDNPNGGQSSSWAAQGDMTMLAYTSGGGKERSEREFEALAKIVGFKQLIKVCSAYSNWIMEFHK
uniref:Caffeic acid O-methyltransferase n=1 Tax=Catalpa bungei TaxID=265496 RepID=A0A411ASI8_9LAMI|nr:caffeic acid O-methyltransferase [Catalpa bungei]QAX90964.1 caffeic acid O-methyltransferase [Catalpa bungei]